MLPKHLSSQEMIQLLEEKKENKLKRKKEKGNAKQRERESRRKNKKRKRKKSDKQKAKTASVRLGKEKKTVEYTCLKCDVLYDDDKPDEIWIECTYHMHRF